MDKKLNQLKRFRLLTPSKDGGFTSAVIAARQENGKTHTSHLLNERIVYSFLGYRSRHQSGASIREIVRETTLHKKTVAKALNNLPHLVHQHDGLWFANEPPADWFCPRTYETAKHWSDRIAYVTLYLPRKKATANGHRFGLNHTAVFSYILSFTKRSNPTMALSINFLSTLLNGLNRKTVSSVLKDLKKIGMIRYTQCGARLEIEFLKLTDSHLDLFQRQPDRTKAQTPAAPQNQPVSNKYEFKDDRFDDYRKICEPLMPQSFAERAIVVGRYFGWDLDEFGSKVRDQKRRSDDNVRAGKCKVSNFGKFFVTPFEEQMRSLEKKRRHEEAVERDLAFRASPEGKKAQAEEDEKVTADPLHPLHEMNQESLTSRVQFSDVPLDNYHEADRVLGKVHRHCSRFATANFVGTQKQVDEGSKLSRKILGTALVMLDGQGKEKALATAAQLEVAIDEAISEVQSDMKPLFGVAREVTSDQHVAPT